MVSKNFVKQLRLIEKNTLESKRINLFSAGRIGAFIGGGIVALDLVILNAFNLFILTSLEVILFFMLICFVCFFSATFCAFCFNQLNQNSINSFSNLYGSNSFNREEND